MKAEENKGCPHCGSMQLSENDQGNMFCEDCARVIEKLNISNMVGFENLKMTGQVVDVNDKINRTSV